MPKAEIAKDETGQMNNACAWFQNNYPGCRATKALIIPTNRVGQAAGFLEEVQIMRDKELKRLLRQVRSFFNEFSNLDWNSLAEAKVQELVNLHRLTVKNIVENYGVKPK
jgi:t-SNARE complex subunit (syntaxin)